MSCWDREELVNNRGDAVNCLVVTVTDHVDRPMHAHFSVSLSKFELGACAKSLGIRTNLNTQGFGSISQGSTIIKQARCYIKMLLCCCAEQLKCAVRILLHYFIRLDFNEVLLTVDVDEQTVPFHRCNLVNIICCCN